MLMSDIMTAPVLTIRPETTVREAITLLTEHGFAGMPVVDEDDQVIGVFTETDAVRFSLSRPNGNAAATREPVASAMTTPVEVAGPDEDVHQVAHRMLTSGLRCIPVVRAGVLEGVVAFRDVLRTLIRRGDVIETAVRRLLIGYTRRSPQWTVEVEAGSVTIGGEFADDAERHVVEALARTVPGVFDVELRSLVRSGERQHPGEWSR